jgi:ribosomal protein S18 acetylase RimI-like enzyme
MTVTVRRATAADIPDIARVHVDTWRSTYPGIVPQDFLDALDASGRAKMWDAEIAKDDCHVLVAEYAGAICGFISGGVLRDGIDVAAQNYDSEIYTLYVLAAAQGRGAGRELMRALAERLVQGGLMRPVVWALEKNPWCGFYERLGGKRVAQKTIEIGGAQLSDVAYGWDEIGRLLQSQVREPRRALPCLPLTS